MLVGASEHAVRQAKAGVEPPALTSAMRLTAVRCAIDPRHNRCPALDGDVFPLNRSVSGYGGGLASVPAIIVGIDIGVERIAFHALHDLAIEHVAPWCHIATDRAGTSKRLRSISSGRQPRIASEQMMYITTNDEIGTL